MTLATEHATFKQQMEGWDVVVICEKKTVNTIALPQQLIHFF